MKNCRYSKLLQLHIGKLRNNPFSLISKFKTSTFLEFIFVSKKFLHHVAGRKSKDTFIFENCKNSNASGSIEQFFPRDYSYYDLGD